MKSVWYYQSSPAHKDLCVEMVSASNPRIQLWCGQELGQDLKDSEEDREPFSALLRAKDIHTEAELIVPLK